MMDTSVIKRIFGERKLVGADASMVNSLVALGPWGLALIAAYLAGQGLVKLVEKIQIMQGPTAPAISLTAEEEAEIRKAIEAMELEHFIQMRPEAVEWIEEHPPESFIKSFSDEQLKAQSYELQKTIEQYRDVPPPQKERCQKIQELRALTEKLRRNAVFAYPAIGPTHLVSLYQTGWLNTCRMFDHWVDVLEHKWGCPESPGQMELYS